MCNPAAAYWAVAAITAYSSYSQGVEAKKTSRYNARVLENEATRTRNKGVTEEMKHREKVQQLISKQRATAGASGVDVGSGSPLQLQNDTELLGEVDALRIRENYLDQAQSLDDRSMLTKREGDAAYRKGVIGAVTAIGSAYAGSGAVSNSWYSGNSAAVTQNVNTSSLNATYGAIA